METQWYHYNVNICRFKDLIAAETRLKHWVFQFDTEFFLWCLEKLDQELHFFQYQRLFVDDVAVLSKICDDVEVVIVEDFAVCAG